MKLTGQLLGIAGPAAASALPWSHYAREAVPVAAGEWRCTAPFTASEGSITVALRGRPMLSNGSGAATRHAQARDVLNAYRARGTEALQELFGAFALAIYDRHDRQLLLAVDRMGVERIAYCDQDGSLHFGSSSTLVSRLAGTSRMIRPQALFDYLLFHMIPSPESLYRGVRRLPAGHCAIFREGRLQLRRYWQPVFNESGRFDFEQAGEELLAALQTAVERCRPTPQTGAFLSGGLDSSSVSGMLARVLGGSARTFSMGFGVEAFNELEYAREAARHFHLDATEYQVTPDDIVDAFELIAAAFDEPFGNSSALPTYICARLAAQRGVTHLLAGDGGDELFGGNTRYATQRVFEHYARLWAPLRRSLEGAAHRIKPEHPVKVLSKFQSYITQASIRLPERLEYWNFVHRSHTSGMLDPEFRSAIDERAALRSMSEFYDTAPANSMVNRMLYYDWQYTLADNDLRKVGAMCELAGVRVDYPMLDQRVIDLSLRVPPSGKVKGAELRHFYRRAMRGFLPDAILRKSKHGFGLPFGSWLKTHRRLADMTYSLLGDLKSRRIVTAAFIDGLIAGQNAEHPGYTGYAIWDLAMLEAWLKQSQQETANNSA